MIDPSEELSRVPQSTKIRAVICAMICNVMIGSYYFFSNINSYVAAYLKQYNPDISAKDTLLIMPIWIVMQSVGTIVSIKLCSSYGYPIVSNVSYGLFAVANLIMVFVKGYWTFVFVYGAFTGLMIGTGYMPALFIAWTYYPETKSIVTGVSLFTAGISASILSPASTAIVNPDNVVDYENDPEVYNRVPFMFFCLFLYFGGLIGIGAILQPPPFESQAIKELKELTALEQEARKENPPGNHNLVEMDVIRQGHDSGAVDHHDASPSKINTDHNVVSDAEMRYVLNKELKSDTEGYISQPEAYAMAGLPADQLASIVTDKKSLQILIGDRKENLRMSIRQSLYRGDQKFKDSVARLKIGNENPEATEKRALDLLTSPNKTLTLEEDQKARQSIKTLVAQCNADCPSLSYALTSWPFVSLAIMAYSCSIYNYFMNSVWKQYYVTKIDVSDKQMALILSYGAFANSIVRVVSGFAMMKYDFKYIYLLLVGSTILCCFTIDTFLVNYAVGSLYSMTVFGGIGIQVTIFPTVCTKMFGPVIGPKVFPFVFSFFSMANLTQYFVLKFTDDWSFMFILFGIIAIVGLGVGFIFTSSPDWRDAQYHYQTALINDADNDANSKPLVKDGKA
jgi:Major Facilitator Superfamily